MAKLSDTKGGRWRLMVLLTFFLALCAVVAVILVRLGFKVYCPFHLITGLNCPGCGNTRAMMALLRLDFKEMFRYNLLFLPEIFYLLRVYFMSVAHYVRKGVFSYRPRSFVPDLIFLILLLAWAVVRNCTDLF